MRIIKNMLLLVKYSTALYYYKLKIDTEDISESYFLFMDPIKVSNEYMLWEIYVKMTFVVVYFFFTLSLIQ